LLFSNLRRRRSCSEHWKGRWTDLFTTRPAWKQQKHSKDCCRTEHSIIRCSSVQQIAKHRSTRTQSWTLLKTSSTSVNYSYKEGVSDCFVVLLPPKEMSW